MDVRETISRLSQVDKSSFGDDEPSRMQALAEARALVSRLERPWEKVGQMVWTEPTLMLSIKTASDMSLFASMSSNGQTSEQLGQATGADPVLVSRLLRVLVSGAIIEEVDVDTYVETDFSKSLVDRQGIVNGIHYYYDLVAKQTEKLPEYLHKTGYKGPSDAANPPFKYIMESSAGFWEWCITHPEAHANFNSFLSSIRVGQPPWPSYYPPSRLLDGFDGSAALCVDVGGGKGRDLKHLVDAIGNEHPEAALVLQDQASVLEEAKSEDIPSQIQLMPHNFFEPQPCKGARAYFMHSILHDWPDAEAHKILMRLKEAGKPGYSKILILEAVMPERARDVNTRMAALDFTMMAHFSSLERTEKQWRSLLEGVGLRFTKLWQMKGNPQGLIEVEM